MRGHEPSVTDASNPKKQIYQKCSATTVILYHHSISSLTIKLERLEVFMMMAINDSHLLGGDLM
jgi:hypothetical protein